MKKVASIAFIIIATIFCFKDIIVIIASDPNCIVMDINEEDDENKTEKDNIDEKSDIKDGQLNNSEQLQVANLIINTSFHTYKEKRHFKPYFEICSPPPEQI